MSYVVDIIRAEEIEVGMTIWIRTKGFHKITVVTKNVLINDKDAVCVWWAKSTSLGRAATFLAREEVLKIHDEKGK